MSAYTHIPVNWQSSDHDGIVINTECFLCVPTCQQNKSIFVYNSPHPQTNNQLKRIIYCDAQSL